LTGLPENLLLFLQKKVSYYPFEPPSRDGIIRAIIVIAIAQELLALLWLVVILLLGMRVSATEVLRSVRPNRINPTRRIAGLNIMTSSSTSTPS
jgi:hypothetical protein